jgi:EmrB/QacA subfamily drug resistance transporter
VGTQDSTSGFHFRVTQADAAVRNVPGVDRDHRRQEKTVMSATQFITPVPTGTATGRRRLGLALAVIATAQLMVVLDTAIVNVALPHIQSSLGFSGGGLEWVVNGYALTFGGLTLLGGRTGDLLGRRAMFVAGLLLFTAASLAGGLATSQAWLVAARVVQGMGAAIVAPTALALITTSFPEGKPRNRAMGIYAAVSALGGAVGLIAGGLLTSYVSWRWVLFVNVPIGVAVMLAAPRVLGPSPRQRARFDLPGGITGTGGVAALVYGLSSGAPGGPSDQSHWGDAKVVAALAAAGLLLTAFAIIEARSRNPLLPLRLLADRSRSGANLAMLLVGTALFGTFFFLTLFLQEVWGYSALRAGFAYLPMTAAIGVASGLSARLVPRVGPRAMLAAGSVTFAGGLYWLSRLSEHDSYVHTVLAPTVLIGAGLGMLFVPITLVAMAKVAGNESGVAASLRNAGQQVGGSVGLAVLGSVVWTVVANSARTARAQAAQAAQAGRQMSASHGAATAAYHQALVTGFSRGFDVAGGIMLVALVITVAMIRIRKADLAGAGAQ